MLNFQIDSHQGTEGILFHFVSSQNDSTAQSVTFIHEGNFVSCSVQFVCILCFLPVCSNASLAPSSPGCFYCSDLFHPCRMLFVIPLSLDPCLSPPRCCLTHLSCTMAPFCLNALGLGVTGLEQWDLQKLSFSLLLFVSGVMICEINK